MSYMGDGNLTSVQNQIQQDWTNREFIEVIITNIKKITDFLNSFELSCKTKMALLDEKLNNLEKKVEYLEAQISKSEQSTVQNQN